MERPAYGRDGNYLNCSNSIGRVQENARVRPETQQAVLAYSFWCERCREKAAGFVVDNEIKTLNLAGPRASNEPDVGNFVKGSWTQRFRRSNAANRHLPIRLPIGIPFTLVLTRLLSLSNRRATRERRFAVTRRPGSILQTISRRRALALPTEFFQVPQAALDWRFIGQERLHTVERVSQPFLAKPAPCVTEVVKRSVLVSAQQ
jgi:hypothetical protein